MTLGEIVMTEGSMTTALTEPVPLRRHRLARGDGMRTVIALAAIVPLIVSGVAACAPGRDARGDASAGRHAHARGAAGRHHRHALGADREARAETVRARERAGHAGRRARALARAAPARAAGVRYVALGDSFTAGPFIPHRHGRPIGCLRSDHNYPSLVARALRPATFTDVSCSAARTADLTHPQSVLLGHNPPQLDAVTPDTTLVTLGIGGNDIGYSHIVLTCAALSVTAPTGAPCARHFGATLDRSIADTAPKIAAALRAIHARAPRARVLVVGYPRALPARLGCWPAVPAAAGDVPYLDGVERRLNAMLAEQARLGGATFVDTYTTSARHDMCSSDKWVEGVIVTNPAAPVHPNAAGMRAVADRVLAVLGASRVAAG